jgi:hypothetical protein
MLGSEHTTPPLFVITLPCFTHLLLVAASSSRRLHFPRPLLPFLASAPRHQTHPPSRTSGETGCGLCRREEPTTSDFRGFCGEPSSLYRSNFHGWSRRQPSLYRSNFNGWSRTNPQISAVLALPSCVLRGQHVPLFFGLSLVGAGVVATRPARTCSLSRSPPPSSPISLRYTCVYIYIYIYIYMFIHVYRCVYTYRSCWLDTSM